MGALQPGVPGPMDFFSQVSRDTGSVPSPPLAQLCDSRWQSAHGEQEQGTGTEKALLSIELFPSVAADI